MAVRSRFLLALALALLSLCCDLSSASSIEAEASRRLLDRNGGRGPGKGEFEGNFRGISYNSRLFSSSRFSFKRNVGKSTSCDDLASWCSNSTQTNRFWSIDMNCTGMISWCQNVANSDYNCTNVRHNRGQLHVRGPLGTSWFVREPRHFSRFNYTGTFNTSSSCDGFLSWCSVSTRFGRTRCLDASCGDMHTWCKNMMVAKCMVNTTTTNGTVEVPSGNITDSTGDGTMNGNNGTSNGTFGSIDPPLNLTMGNRTMDSNTTTGNFTV